MGTYHSPGGKRKGVGHTLVGNRRGGIDDPMPLLFSLFGFLHACTPCDVRLYAFLRGGSKLLVCCLLLSVEV